MAEEEYKTANLADIEDKLVDAFNLAFEGKNYSVSGNSGPLSSIGSIAEAIVKVRQQRDIENGDGEKYQKRYVQQVPFQRKITNK